MKFKKYKQTNIAEMAEWEPIGYETHEAEKLNLINMGISISQTDLNNNSPRIGDMIARNPENHNDMWLISEDYFRENFEEIS